jgi:teichuronic acid biosynthesis protein TuaF
MIDILIRIKNRAKRWMLFLIIFPLVTAGIAYILENQTSPVYTAKSIVELGNFENERLTDPKALQKLLKSTAFLEEIKEKQDANFNVADVKGRLAVNQGDGKIIELQITGPDKAEGEATLESVVEGFINLSKELYDHKVEIVNTSIKNAEESTSPDEVAKRAEVLYELNMVLTDLRETKELEPVTVSGEYKNPVKRAIFGLLLGLMLNIVLLITPELFRDYTKE